MGRGYGWALLFACGMASGQPVKHLMEKELRKASALPGAAVAAEAPLRSALKSALQAAAPPRSNDLALGLFVKFRAPEVQRLANANLPPPAAQQRAVEVLAGHGLKFERAMSQGVLIVVAAGNSSDNAV